MRTLTSNTATGFFAVGISVSNGDGSVYNQATDWRALCHFATYKDAVKAFTDMELMRKSYVHPFSDVGFPVVKYPIMYEIWFVPFGLPQRHPVKKGEVYWKADDKGELSFEVVEFSLTIGKVERKNGEYVKLVEDHEHPSDILSFETNPRLVSNDEHGMFWGEFFPFPIRGTVHDVKLILEQGSDLVEVHPDDADVKEFEIVLDSGLVVRADLTKKDDTTRYVIFDGVFDGS